MKKAVDIVAAMILGFGVGAVYFYQQHEVQSAQVYGSRNVEAEVKAEIDRVNIILNDAEKKYIKTSVPKPKPPNPIECGCNGTKEITHGDGHKTPCPCGQNCVCSPKATPQ